MYMSSFSGPINEMTNMKWNVSSLIIGASDVIPAIATRQKRSVNKTDEDQNYETYFKCFSDMKRNLLLAYSTSSSTATQWTSFQISKIWLI